MIDGVFHELEEGDKDNDPANQNSQPYVVISKLSIGDGADSQLVRLGLDRKEAQILLQKTLSGQISVRQPVYDSIAHVTILESVTATLDSIYFPTRNSGNWRRGPHWREELGNAANIVKQVWLEWAIKNKKWEDIHERQTGDSALESRRFESVFGRKVWIMWIKGKLPIKLPQVVGWDDRAIALVFDEFWSPILEGAARSINPGIRMIRAFSAGAEILTRNTLSMRDIRIGN
jgi:hypothetical protein